MGDEEDSRFLSKWCFEFTSTSQIGVIPENEIYSDEALMRYAQSANALDELNMTCVNNNYI